MSLNEEQLNRRIELLEIEEDRRDVINTAFALAGVLASHGVVPDLVVERPRYPVEYLSRSIKLPFFKKFDPDLPYLELPGWSLENLMPRDTFYDMGWIPFSPVLGKRDPNATKPVSGYFLAANGSVLELAYHRPFDEKRALDPLYGSFHGSFEASVIRRLQPLSPEHRYLLESTTLPLNRLDDKSVNNAVRSRLELLAFMNGIVFKPE